MLLIHVSFLAYAVEHGEPLAVRSETIENILRSMAENNQVPEVMIDDSQEGYIKIGTLLVDADKENE